MITPKFEIRRFKDLTAAQLYELLRLRTEVFIVEQNCVYQDIDGKDAKALHLLGTIEGRLVAYARLFRPGDYFPEASIGRVVIESAERDKKWGHLLMHQAIEAIKVHFDCNVITISAQLYLKRFYEDNGFVQNSDVYDEDGIPHIRMVRE